MEQVSRRPKLDYKRKKPMVIIAAFVFAAAFGPLDVAMTLGSFPSRIISLVGWFGVSVLVFSWVYFDSRQRNRSITTNLRLLIVFLGLFGLWIYLIRSRGLKQGLISSLAALGLFAGMALVMILSGTLVLVLLDVSGPGL